MLVYKWTNTAPLWLNYGTYPLTHRLLRVRGDVTVVGHTVRVIYSRTLYHKWKLCIYIGFNPSLCICLHRQQVPERNQKKKKKMKWRAERSASSHRFHCAILWPRSSCLFFRLKHTHVNLDSLEGARCRGLSPEHKNDGRREKRMGTVGPSRCLWMMPSPVHYLCCLSRTFTQFIQNQHWIFSRSFLTFISNAAQDGRRQDKAERSTSPWLVELLYLLGEGRKETWLAFHHYLHFYTHTGATWDSPVRRLAVVWESRMQLNVKAGERRSDAAQPSDVPILGAPRSGTLSVMFLCEERAVERERKVASRRLSGEHCGLIGV